MDDLLQYLNYEYYISHDYEYISLIINNDSDTYTRIWEYEIDFYE